MSVRKKGHDVNPTMVPTNALRRCSVRASAAGNAEEEGECYKLPPPDVAQFVERPQSPGIR